MEKRGQVSCKNVFLRVTRPNSNLSMEWPIRMQIQALDELGRWENARVAENAADGTRVTFSGWDRSFDRVVKRGEIRRLVDPFFLGPGKYILSIDVCHVC
jgi:hypothetical protein